MRDQSPVSQTPRLSNHHKPSGTLWKEGVNWKSAPPTLCSSTYPPNPNFLAGQSTPVIFKLLRLPGVPSLTSPQMTLPERVTGRLTPDAAGQGARSPHPQITRGRRVAVKSDYRMWISPELRGGPSGPAGRERCRQAGATPGSRMWIARSRGAPREGLPLLNVYLRPVPRTHAVSSSRVILSRSPWE